MLLVPGYTGSKEDFGPILGPLAERGFLATAVDLPGQYQSPGTADPAAYTPDALAPVVLAIAAQLGGDVHLLGHSYGGLVARAAVIADVAKDGGRIRSLVLLSSGPAAVPGHRRRAIEQLAPVLASGGMPGVYAAMQAVAATTPGYVAPEPALAGFLRERFLASSPAMLRGMGEAIRIEPDRVAELATALARAALPALVLFGDHDDAWPPSVQAEMALHLGAESAVVADAAHSPAVENPEQTVRTLAEFWLAGE